jgi:hypothetical protein
MKAVGYILNAPWTLVGVVVALVSVPTRVRFMNGAIVFNVRSAWWKNLHRTMRKMNVRAWTHGNVISLGPLEEKNDLAHEFVHVR